MHSVKAAFSINRGNKRSNWTISTERSRHREAPYTPSLLIHVHVRTFIFSLTLLTVLTPQCHISATEDACIAVICNSNVFLVAEFSWRFLKYLSRSWFSLLAQTCMNSSNGWILFQRRISIRNAIENFFESRKSIYENKIKSCSTKNAKFILRACLNVSFDELPIDISHSHTVGVICT